MGLWAIIQWLTRKQTTPMLGRNEKQNKEVQVDEWAQKQCELIYELQEELVHRQEQIDHKQELIEHLENLVSTLRYQIQLGDWGKKRDERISMMPSGHVYHFSRQCEYFAKGKWFNPCQLCKDKAERSSSSYEGSMSNDVRNPVQS